MDGVYTILCKQNNKIYVGSAVNVKAKRWSKYKSELNKGIYNNKVLQEDWTKYGSDAFEFTLIEECIENRREREKYWKEYYESQGSDLYNNNKIVTITIKERTEEEKARIHENMSRAQRGENNPRCRKLDSDDVYIIKHMINAGVSNTEIAKKFNISESYVSEIRTGRKWSHIQLVDII